MGWLAGLNVRDILILVGALLLARAGASRARRLPQLLRETLTQCAEIALVSVVVVFLILHRCLFQLFFPTRGIRDYTCGYRAYRASVLTEAFRRYGDDFVNQEGFQCMVDILIKLRRMDLIFREVPLILRYDLKGGASKMNVARTVRRTLELMAQRRLGR